MFYHYNSTSLSLPHLWCDSEVNLTSLLLFAEVCTDIYQINPCTASVIQSKLGFVFILESD